MGKGNISKSAFKQKKLEETIFKKQVGFDDNVITLHRTSLMDACMKGDLEFVENLLKGNPKEIEKEVNRFDERGETALIYAAKIPNFNTRLSIIEELLKSGAVPNVVDGNGTPVMVIAMYDVKDHATETKIVQAFINTENIKVDGKGVYSENRFVRDSKDYTTPLMMAVEHGNLKAAELLIAAKADVNLKDKHGWSAIKYAFHQKNANLNSKEFDGIIETLVNNNANIESVRDDIKAYKMKNLNLQGEYVPKQPPHKLELKKVDDGKCLDGFYVEQENVEASKLTDKDADSSSVIDKTFVQGLEFATTNVNNEEVERLGVEDDLADS